ncbi:MAG TPA: amino acid adenylation domain-containing protein, partial [Rhizomicrobium sp.]
MIVGILAILKAGCAYLPIDRDCPADRVLTMLEDAGAGKVLLAGGASWQDEKRLVFNLDDSALYRGNAANIAGRTESRSLAYVIYTSGTTGVPKGVMIEHHSVNNLCVWFNHEFSVTAADRGTKCARFSFDASVWEIFPYLQAGAAIHVVDDEIRLDLARFNRFLERNAITICFLPTQLCELFTEFDNNSLRLLLTGGDRLRRVEARTYRIVNNYGPTENTVVATSCDAAAGTECLPIGKPVFNTRVYILRDGTELVPVGVPGELCISGAGLARGYLHDPEKTAEKFVPNPFEPGAVMYRTGDLARWLPDGRIAYIGRIDNQVKIRGCRVEPREIEVAILSHQTVKDAVVVARQDSRNTNVLHAYVVWHGVPTPAELRAHLAKRLPDYMVPAFIVTVDEIPLNPRGKIDPTRLPKAEGEVSRDLVMARTNTERRLADIWNRVLDRERVGIHDNFFEIGGDSLRATIMLARANKEFEADVALGAVFDNPTVAALARCYDGVTRHRSTAIGTAEPRLYYPTTPTQSLLYAVCNATKGVEYNLPFVFELRGDLNVERLEAAFRRLIERHEAFRTSFHMVGGSLMLTVSPSADFAIDILPPCSESDIEEVARDFIRPFDLGRAPLLRVALLPLGPAHHVLLIDVHHLVSDGTSMGLMYQEVAALYAGDEPPLPATTFKDFAVWLKDHLQTKRVNEQEKYWLEVFKEPLPVPRLDTDYPRPKTPSFVGNRLHFTVGPELHGGLRAICAEHGATLYMVLLAAYDILLSRYTGREDIIVGVPTAGRYVADVQDVIGMFVSTHATRNRVRAELRFDEFLEQVKSGVLGALENQEYQLWSLMIAHTLKNSGSPLFGSVFVVQDQAFVAMRMPGLTVEER